MDTSLSPGMMITLFGIMVVLAAIPGTSVLTVTARSVSSGFTHGALTALGIVTGDVIFVLIAIYGLALLVETMGDLFFLVKYIGGAYLIWLGIQLWQSVPGKTESKQTSITSPVSSFMAGLLLTLGDQKAILFYLAFFPAFINLQLISVLDGAIIILITIVSVGGVKLVYAYLADRNNWLRRTRVTRLINAIAGATLIGVGILLVIKS